MAENCSSKLVNDSPKDLESFWNAASPLYHDEQLSDEDSERDPRKQVPYLACRDACFIILDYYEIVQNNTCEYRFIRLGVDLRVSSEADLFFGTVALAVLHNLECSLYVSLVPPSGHATMKSINDKLRSYYECISTFAEAQFSQCTQTNSWNDNATVSSLRQHSLSLDGLSYNPMTISPTMSVEDSIGGYPDTDLISRHRSMSTVPSLSVSDADSTAMVKSKNGKSSRKLTNVVSNQLRNMSNSQANTGNNSILPPPIRDMNTYKIPSLDTTGFPIPIPMTMEMSHSSNSSISSAPTPGTLSPLDTPSERNDGDTGVSRRKRYRYMQIAGLAEPILTPKGVSKTNFGYRVQLNVRKSDDPNQNRKFSRNAKKFVEALWLYEIAILISDAPRDVHVMIGQGNYCSLLSMQICKTTEEYYVLLGQAIHYCVGHNLLTLVERDAALRAYQALETNAISHTS